MLLFVYRNTL